MTASRGCARHVTADVLFDDRIVFRVADSMNDARYTARVFYNSSMPMPTSPPMSASANHTCDPVPPTRSTVFALTRLGVHCEYAQTGRRPPLRWPIRYVTVPLATMRASASLPTWPPHEI